MISLLRKHQQILLPLITVLVIIAFVAFYNGGARTYDRASGTDRVEKIYGEFVSQTKIDREARKFDVAIRLRLSDLLNALVGRATTQEQALENFVWNSLVLRHEAARLQIEPTDEDVAAALKALPVFQTDGAFDSGKYAEFLQDVLSPRGFDAAQLEELMRDDLRLKKIRALVDSTFVISPSAVRAYYLLTKQKMDVSVIRFSVTDLAAGVQVSEADVKKMFEQNKNRFMSEEKRGTKFVTFTLTDPEKALAGRQRIDALQKLANRASDFTQAMLDKNAKFDEVAAKFQTPVTTTPPFAQSAPDAKIAQQPAVVEGVFHLSRENPNSDVIQGENSFYVLHLEEIVPARPLTLDEARPQIISQIRNDRAHEMLSVKAAESRAKIQAAMKEGKSFADAARTAGQKIEAFPPFSLEEPNLEKPDSREITIAAVNLSDGQLSEFVPTADGGVLIHLDKREPVNEAAFEKDKTLIASILAREKQARVFGEWLRKQRQAAGIQNARQAS